jgi:rhomboid family GlyGly-CTERM serine protease
MKRPPWYTLAGLAATWFAWSMPHAAEWLVYDRQAILKGELWRLLTGHLVHFSTSHLLYNLAAFALAGWLLESRTHAPRPIMFLTTPLVISTAMLGFDPFMTHYGGLSGLVTALWVYLALDYARRPGISRFLSATTLTLFLGKTAWEYLYAAPLFAQPDTESFQVATLSHLTGAGWACLVFGTWSFHKEILAGVRERPVCEEMGERWRAPEGRDGARIRAAYVVRVVLIYAVTGAERSVRRRNLEKSGPPDAGWITRYFRWRSEH